MRRPLLLPGRPRRVTGVGGCLRTSSPTVPRPAPRRPDQPHVASTRLARVDAFTAIASKRDERRYADRPIPEDALERILDAGRLSGSSQNKQEWEFVVVSDHDAFADTVYAPHNVRTAALVIAIICPRAFDVGRAAQNMMLAAWGEGIVSCPNGVADASAAAEQIGGAPAIVLSFGYPERPRDPDSRSAEEWSRRANRKPLDEVSRRV
jgi:nitroreductase